MKIEKMLLTPSLMIQWKANIQAVIFPTVGAVVGRLGKEVNNHQHICYSSIRGVSYGRCRRGCLCRWTTLAEWHHRSMWLASTSSMSENRRSRSWNNRAKSLESVPTRPVERKLEAKTRTSFCTKIDSCSGSVLCRMPIDKTRFFINGVS